MHIVIGFVQILFATVIAAIYRCVRTDWLGRRVIRLCCSAFTAGSGLDDASIRIVRDMGPDGLRFLEAESHDEGGHGVASLMLTMLRTQLK